MILYIHEVLDTKSLQSLLDQLAPYVAAWDADEDEGHEDGATPDCACCRQR